MIVQPPFGEKKGEKRIKGGTIYTNRQVKAGKRCQRRIKREREKGVTRIAAYERQGGKHSFFEQSLNFLVKFKCATKIIRSTKARSLNFWERSVKFACRDKKKDEKERGASYPFPPKEMRLSRKHRAATKGRL